MSMTYHITGAGTDRIVQPDGMLPYLCGLADAAGVDVVALKLNRRASFNVHMPAPQQVEGICYVIRINGVEMQLPPEWVIPYVYGVADYHRAARHLNDALKADAPVETSRIQALQIGDARGWLDYLYLRR